MNIKKSSYLIYFTTITIIIYLLGFQNSYVSAQNVSENIVPDNTLGEEGSQVNHGSGESNNITINGGATRGENLFHSFSDFNVGEGEVVNFVNPENIANIFSRVTGRNISRILGDLGVSGNANLFLMNPNGIVFGEKASLNVNGSFVATTANGIHFAGGSQFLANPIGNKPLLTVNVPIGLQFGNEPGKIVNQAQSPQKAASNSQFNFSGNPAGLLVQQNQTLALIGGEILLEGGNLTALGGNIEIASVGENSLVGLELTELGFAFDYSSVDIFSDIILTNRDGFILTSLEPFRFSQSQVLSAIDATSNETSGSIEIWGRNIDVVNGSQIISPTFGNADGGDLVINAREQLTVSGENIFSSDKFSPFPSFSIILNSTVGDGNAGNININTKKLVVRDSGSIASNSTSSNNIPGQGNGGNIELKASESIVIESGGKITSNSLGTGKAGNILTKAQSLSLDDNSSILASTFQSNGGNIDLQIDNNIELRNQSNISASVGGTGNGGNINIATEFLITSPQDNSDLTASAESGNGGNISIDASGIFGLKIQNEATDFSEINTGSNFGTDGTVTLLNTDLQTDAINSEDEVQLVESAIEYTPNYCYANKQNRYIRAGRGGIPLDSTTMLIPQYTWEDWRIIETEDSEVETTNNLVSENNIETQNKNTSLTPIQGWFVNERGEVVLTANPMMIVPHPQESQASGC